MASVVGAGIGITPAYAGKTVEMEISALGKKDHPRLRGENFVCLTGDYAAGGSPPPTRGKLLILFL